MHLEYAEMLAIVIHAESMKMKLISVKVLLRTLMRSLRKKRRHRRALNY